MGAEVFKITDRHGNDCILSPVGKWIIIFSETVVKKFFKIKFRYEEDLLPVYLFIKAFFWKECD